MRLLSLATLGAANQEVPYSLISKTLQIDENDVENWVITAMSEDVLEARMDQSRRIVTIRYTVK
jgi:translation initiation factor 3 subunit M